MHFPPVVFTHVHKCAGTSLRQMLYRKFEPLLGRRKMHIPEFSCKATDNLPMLEDRGEPLPEKLMLLADHSPFGLYDKRVLAQGEPFRMTLLRQPIDRFESYICFSAREGLFPEAWSKFLANLEEMPEADFIEMCHHFDVNSGYVTWFDPLHHDLERALSNLLECQIIARHHNILGLCTEFNRINPYGLKFHRHEVVHVNKTPRPSRLSVTQREIAREVLARDSQVWHSPSVQRAMEIPAPL